MTAVTGEARAMLHAAVCCALRGTPDAEARADVVFAAAEHYGKALAKAEQEAAARRLVIAAAEHSPRRRP